MSLYPMSTQSEDNGYCVCGHVKEHHGKQEMIQLPYYPNCQWRGCGCPFYVTPAAPEVCR